MTGATPSVRAERKRFEPGRFAVNIMHFARALRAAGMPVGPGKVLDALRAVEAVGVGRRSDFYWTLHAVFVNRRDQRELFDQAFHIFWRKPDLLEKAMQLLLPQIEAEAAAPQEVARRLAEALAPQKAPGEARRPRMPRRGSSWTPRSPSRPRRSCSTRTSRTCRRTRSHKPGR